MTKKTKTTGKERRNARFHKPSGELRRKVGTGGLPARQIEKAETLIDENKTDFAPFARKILRKLEKTTAEARKKKPAGKAVIRGIAQPIMEIKAAGKMFRYGLVSDIATVALDFLESVHELNEDGFDIIDVHYRTIDALIRLQLKGGGGNKGREVAQELYDACYRYRKKYGIA